MRILIHSNAPWVPTGYGKQCRLLADQLRYLGHEVGVSAFSGLSGSAIVWEGLMVYPSGIHAFGTDVLIGHAQAFGAELIITLMDFWKLGPIARELQAFRVAAWLPNDCTPLGRPDRRALHESGALAIAMTDYGERNLRAAGFEVAAVIPHAVDLGAFHPLTPTERGVLRRDLGLDPDQFIVGINAANKDTLRKAWPEQLQAFARFHEDHPDSRLLIHTITESPNGLDIARLATDLGLLGEGDVVFTDQYAQLAGMISDPMLNEWYNTLDLLSMTTYAEGFGIPIIEAHAAGVPVLTTRKTAPAELNPHGPSVNALDFWNPVHRAFWRRPDITAITRAYHHAYTQRHHNDAARAAARTQARAYDHIYLADTRWKPFLDTITTTLSAPDTPTDTPPQDQP